MSKLKSEIKDYPNKAYEFETIPTLEQRVEILEKIIKELTS